MKTLYAMESLVEDVPQINFVIYPAVIEDCDQIYELVQVRLFIYNFKYFSYKNTNNYITINS